MNRFDYVKPLTFKDTCKFAVQAYVDNKIDIKISNNSLIVYDLNGDALFGVNYMAPEESFPELLKIIKNQYTEEIVIEGVEQYRNLQITNGSIITGEHSKLAVIKFSTMAEFVDVYDITDPNDVEPAQYKIPMKLTYGMKVKTKLYK